MTRGVRERAEGMTSAEGSRQTRPTLAAWLCVLCVSLIVYFPLLGSTGLSMTEGHRAIPGFEMLERARAGDADAWWLPTLFGQAYLRKPPGVSWAIAGSARVFGENELAARWPSAIAATSLAMVALWFGSRWFGRRAGLASGLAQALWPLMWSAGRSAEIEAMNSASAAVATWLVIDIMIGRDSRKRTHAATLAAGFALGLALTIMALCKGPAGMPVVLGGLIGACWAQRSWRGLRSMPLWLGGGLACGVLGYCLWRVDAAVATSQQTPVLQGPSEFLWSGEKLSVAGVGQVMLMPVIALASALPASLALLFPWGGDAKREAAGNSGAAPQWKPYVFARTVALACVLSLALLASLGVDNPRYAMPSVAVLPILVGYVVVGLDARFTPIRRRIARAMLLDSSGRGPGLWHALLLFAAAVWIFIGEPRARATSGRVAGEELGHKLLSDELTLADHMIEARPEVLWYAMKADPVLDRRPSATWKPGGLEEALRDPSLSGHEHSVLVRSDAGSDEAARIVPLLIQAGYTRTHTGRVAQFQFELWRRSTEPAPAESQRP